jgi:hypothetical protein
MAFGSVSPDPDYDVAVDCNADGVIGGPDLACFGMWFGDPPGPSGLPCAGTPPCAP